MLTKNFHKLNKNDAAIAGGKGASLGEMTQAGIPVPPGFVVLSDAFEQFIKETDLVQEIDAILHKVNHKEIHTVESASEEIRALILNAEMPKDIADEITAQFKELNTKYVAVRSSATAEDGMDHAWAGQLESYLNTKEDDVLSKVKLCWSSLFTPRAIFYRFEKGLHTTKISVAVVIQKMVESEISGIAFSVHPVTEDYNQLIIEAGFGLGEAIVSGSITPDSYVIEKTPRNILDINVSKQDRGLYRSEKSSAEHGNNEWKDIPEPKASSQVLTKEQILELSEIIISIESHYGFPCDIEWAFESGKFYIVQSRPITTLSKRTVNSSEQIPASQSADSFSLHFRQTDFPFIFTDIAFRKSNYGQLDYVVLQEKDLIAGYLSAKGVQQALELGSKLLEKSFADSVVSELRSLDNDLNNSATIKEWKEIEYLCDRIGKLYLYCEHPVQAALEEQIREACRSEDDLVKVLHDASYADKIGFTDLQKEYLNRIKEFGELKYSIHNAIGPLFENLITLMTKLANQENITLDQALVLRSDEVDQILSKKSSPDKVALSQRIKGLVFFPARDEGQQIFVDDEYKKWKEILEPKNVTRVHGNIAFRGKAKGKVKVHLSLIASGDIEPGTVLVSGMTNPQIVPYLKNAVGIVTDEGGLTCHAAIISRELKIPCIIGTKIATQVFKDGDMVEVDAEMGVVTKI